MQKISQVKIGQLFKYNGQIYLMLDWQMLGFGKHVAVEIGWIDTVGDYHPFINPKWKSFGSDWLVELVTISINSL